jgi:hypothetical protein
VVGGGPAGLFLAARTTALSPALRDAGILVLEKMADPGRKLLASGAGQCNITHQGQIEEFLRHYGGAGRFLKKSLYAFSNEGLALWLGERGIELEAEEGGKLFPASRKASDVLRALLEECERMGVSIRTDSRAAAARREGEAFVVETVAAGGSSAAYRAPLLAIASGGRSYPGTGSSGEGYALAEALGHSIVPPRPALAPIVMRDKALCALAGTGFEGLSFAIRRGGKTIGRSSGDVLITHEGLSGPGILDASRGLAPGDILELDFSGLGLEAFRAALAARVAASPRALARTLLAEACSPAARAPGAGLPKRLASLICSCAGLAPEARCSDLRREARDAMARMAAAFPAEIAALGGFDKAMATAGGVSLDEVDPATMESRFSLGLYFAGEVLDYDGDTGGFNLQAAFSTADAAARAMAARISRMESKSH